MEVYHTTEVCKKLSKTCRWHHVPLLLSSISITLYSHLFLTMVSRHGALPINPLFREQQKILRAIKFQPFSAPSSPIFHSLKILKLQDVLHTNIFTVICEAFNKLSPCFHDYFQLNATVSFFQCYLATGCCFSYAQCF